MRQFRFCRISSPVYVSVIVLGFLQGMSNVTLSHSQGVTHQAGNQIPIAVVANDEVWCVAMAGCDQFRFHCLGSIRSKPLQVWPNLKPTGRNPRFTLDINPFLTSLEAAVVPAPSPLLRPAAAHPMF